jgi:hypothetical protein
MSLCLMLMMVCEICFGGEIRADDYLGHSCS